MNCLCCERKCADVAVDQVPLLANMKPHGLYHMSDLDKVGGVPLVMKELLTAGLLHGDVVTCTGKTVAQRVPVSESKILQHPHAHRLEARGQSI